MIEKTKDHKTQFDLTKYIIEVNAKEWSLTKVDKLVLISLSNYMQKDQYGQFKACPSQITLADITGLNRNTVGNSLDKMEKLGYIHSEMRHDNSKVYTWLGFESNKTIEVVNFTKACQDKAERKRELDRKRGEILGRNNAECKKLLRFAETLKQNGNIEDSERQLEKIKVIKQATKHNTYYKDYQPYKDLIKVSIVSVAIETCKGCGNILDDGFCDNTDCDYIPF